MNFKLQKRLELTLTGCEVDALEWIVNYMERNKDDINIPTRRGILTLVEELSEKFKQQDIQQQTKTGYYI